MVEAAVAAAPVATPAAAPPIAAIVPDAPGLWAELTASPTFLLPSGLDSGLETGPTGVTAEDTGELYAGGSSSWRALAVDMRLGV